METKQIKNMSRGVYFVTGIDTDVGKSYATGYLASRLMGQGISVVTQKLVQTGVGGDLEAISADILIHRHIMGIEPLPEDIDHTTAPIRLSYPSSPSLAAKLEGTQVDLRVADRATSTLKNNYDVVLVEGAGGVMVPIMGHYTMLDYVVERDLPVVVVTSARLGSVNHTILTLEMCRTRGARVAMVVYNKYPVSSPEIESDSRDYFKEYLSEYMPDCEFIEMPVMGEV